MEYLFKYNEKIIDEVKLKNAYKKASVVALEYPIDGEKHIAIIKRNEYEGNHSGQFALPGGKWDESDKDLEYTAKREVWEEVGVDLMDIDLNFFHEQWVDVSKFIISCYHVELYTKPTFKLNEKEVNCLIEIPKRDFYNSNNLFKQELMYHGRKFDSPYFLINNNKIWGATALILIKLFNLK